jgi:hypothetical protein
MGPFAGLIGGPMGPLALMIGGAFRVLGARLPESGPPAETLSQAPLAVVGFGSRLRKSEKILFNTLFVAFVCSEGACRRVCQRSSKGCR